MSIDPDELGCTYCGAIPGMPCKPDCLTLDFIDWTSGDAEEQ